MRFRPVEPAQIGLVGNAEWLGLNCILVEQTSEYVIHLPSGNQTWRAGNGPLIHVIFLATNLHS